MRNSSGRNLLRIANLFLKQDPIVNEAPGFFGQIDELKGAPFSRLSQPGNFGRGGHRFVDAVQLERDTNGLIFLEWPNSLKGHPLFADVDRKAPFPGPRSAYTSDSNF